MSKGKRMVDSNSNKSTNKKYKNVIKIFFLLIMLAVILILFLVFKKTSFKIISPKKIDNTVNIIEEVPTNSALDSKPNNKAKTIVGNDNIDGIGSRGHDLGCDILEDLDVGLCQLQTGLAGLSGNAGGDDHDVGILGIGVFTAADDGRCAERNALIHVQRLAKGLGLVDVNHENLRGDTHGHHIVGNGGTHAACTDDSNFSHK